ncbi:MAG: ABC transporter substrate-binding protein [Deltaproteobacteria bacterium]|nr:ABC transporter substrate-binding protein [Deltaproteobacteria bacterium]MBW1934380.1 ABC transporter substrate-binding protein [Deltaproteobacteria bacterium]MBW1976524.1 ABC transporter substrate-binding protein [Deltaproteobacteria bacterium]MBW2043780.1 ABC transporter substrate-binding protein [Deltaproteobacteria bacterium]MBW2298703.1 ABC transporter substrate-binding protein [Deltaproteobacteria bacterium]
MARNKLALIACLVIAVVALSLFTVRSSYAKTLYVGGTMALTGAYAEDTAAVLAGYQDYVKYVNETKNLAPWRNEKFPSDISLELLWRDDELKPPKALSIYEELKAKGMLVFRCSGSPQALALKDRLFEDGFGAPSMATGPYLLTPPQSVFTYYPIYTDSLAAVADWFMENWKEKRKPRVAYLTADNAMGRSIVVPELTNYLKKVGYEFVGTQFVPLVPTSPPTTQLMWLKKKKVDLALGVMINPGSQPTVKEMVRLGMGPNQPYKIVFGVPAPGHTAVFAAAMGKLGDGYVCAGSFPPMDQLSIPGIKFCNDLQNKYHPGKQVTHIMYEAGIIEAMTQTEALRLAMQKVPFEKLTPRAVLENGFYRIKGLETGGMTSTPLTYGKGDIEGIDKVRVDQVQNGKVVKLGSWPCRHLYKRK